MSRDEIISRSDKIEGWMSIEELNVLYDLGMQYIHPGGIVCEVGSWKGRSAYLLASICKEKGARLISIDTFAGSPDQAYRTYEEALANPMKFFEENVKKNLEGLPVSFIIQSSTSAHKEIQDNSLCFCFIDGDHHDPALTSDLNNFWHKMEAKGVFCGHDYTSSGDTDVKVAVDKKFPHIQVKGSIFITEKPKINVTREAGTYCRGQRDIMAVVNDVAVPGNFEIYMEPNFVDKKPFWALDNQRLMGQGFHEDKIRRVSCVIYTQPSLKTYFEGLNPHTCLAMWAAYADFHKPYPEEKIFDVGYIGQEVDGRGEALAKLRDYFKVYSEDHVYEDYSQKLSRCKVLFNKSRLGELNLRLYESMAIGATVTDYTPDLQYVGEEGKHFLSYKTMEEAKEKIQYLLDNLDKREQMAKDAREHFLNNHTFLHRLNKICEYLKNERLECA